MTLKEQKESEQKRVYALLNNDLELADYFNNNRYVDFVDYFSKKYTTSKSIIQQYLKDNAIKKTKEQIEQQRQKTNNERYNAGGKLRKKNIDYETLIKLYVEELRSVQEIVDYFDGQYSLHDVRDNLHRYKIYRSKKGNPNYCWKDNKSRKLQQQQTCLQKYGTKNPMQNNDVIRKGQETKEKRYGDNWKEEMYKRTSNSVYKSYGVNNIFEDYNYISSKVYEKYHVNNYAQTAEFKQQMHKFWQNITEEELKLINKKRETTFNELYGGIGLSSDIIRAKVEETMLNTYGVINPFLLPHEKFSYKKKHSGPNEYFYKLARKYFSEDLIEREFVVANRQFDFKINNWLIEINPWITHNVNWSIFDTNKGIDQDYHKNKSKLAFDNGFICIHIFDWVLPESVLQFIKQHDTGDVVVNYGDPVQYIINTKTLDIVSEKSKDTVIIYDDGSDIYRFFS